MAEHADRAVQRSVACPHNDVALNGLIGTHKLALPCRLVEKVKQELGSKLHGRLICLIVQPSVYSAAPHACIIAQWAVYICSDALPEQQETLVCPHMT